MRSKIFIGHVEHHRYHPVAHHLRYPIYMYGLDLDELSEIDRKLYLFGYNRIRPTSIHDADYLQPGAEPIREKVCRFLADNGCKEPVKRVFLITSARYFNYVFNPVSFHYCFAENNRLLGVIAEVNNTYGERHLYMLSGSNGTAGPYPAEYQAEKQFHVSPFNNLEGTYHFSFSDVQDDLEIRIRLVRDQQTVFEAGFSASARPLTPSSHVRTLLRHPVAPHLSIPRIYWEAFKLFFIRKLPFHSKPVPVSPRTIGRVQPGAFTRLCRRILFRSLANIATGYLEIRMPAGNIIGFGRSNSGRTARMDIKDDLFFRKIILDGEIGLGESYMAGQWDTPDPVGLFRLLIENRERLSEGNLATSFWSRIRERRMHAGRENTQAGSRSNIRRHYDLGNDFYRLFLDSQMMYSCALFQSSSETLEEAQANKLQAVVQKARITADDHVLEIGCGWGGFAIAAVKQTGCRVTGITVSEAQFAYARQRVREEGLEDRITIVLEDYRNMRGQYDVIVSIEMIEAVGKRYLGSFFQQCERLLAPGGLIVLQTITIPDQRYPAYLRRRDWIQKYIFPGGHLPSVSVLARAMAGHSKLVIDHLENIGIHYAGTLRMWRERFLQNIDRIRSMGFDSSFIRMWIYYFSICEAAFAGRVLGDHQLVLTRPGNDRLNLP